MVDQWPPIYPVILVMVHRREKPSSGQRAKTPSWDPTWTPWAWTGGCSSGGRGSALGMQRWSCWIPAHQEPLWDVLWFSLVSLMLTPVCRSKDLPAWDRASLLQGVLHPWQPTQADLRGCQSGLQNGRRRAAQHRNGKRAAADREVHPSAPGCRWRLLDRPAAQSRPLPGWRQPSMPLPVLLAGREQG